VTGLQFIITKSDNSKKVERLGHIDGNTFSFYIARPTDNNGDSAKEFQFGYFSNVLFSTWSMIGGMTPFFIGGTKLLYTI